MKLRTERVETWIEVEGEIPGEKASFLVKPLTPREISDLLDKSVDKEWERGQRFKEPNFYDYKIRKIRTVILDWKGIEDEVGNPIKCTDKSKEDAYLYNPELIDKVMEMADALYQNIKQSQEVDEKNLRPAQPGTAISK